MKNNCKAVVIVGLAAVVVCAALLFTQAHAKRQAWRTAVADHHAAVAHCQQLGRDANDLIQAARAAGITRVEFVERFGEISALSQGRRTDGPANSTHVFTHQPSHRIFYLRFDGDVLVGVSSSHGPEDIQPHLPSIEQRIASMK